MNIIIAGAGRVGFNLAQSLSGVGHDVTVIDANAEALRRLQDSLDVLTIHGNIEDPLTYRKLIGTKADLFIAVTNVDEANLLSTLIIDDAIQIDKKFIRLKNNFFAKSSIKEKLGIYEAVFPMELISEKVAMLLQFPRANNIKRFKYTRKKLLSVRVSEKVEPLYVSQMKKCVVAGIERDKSFLIPAVDEIIQPKDLVYLFGDDDDLRDVSNQFEVEIPKKINRCAVLGAGDLGIAVAQELAKSGREVKLIGRDQKVCELANEKLGGVATTIHCGYGSPSSWFKDEGIVYADMFIAATNDDEYNIVKCIEAKEHGIQKVIAINNLLEYYNLMHSLGLVVVRGSKTTTYYAILEGIYSSRVVSGRKFCGGKALVLMRKIFPNSKLLEQRIKPYDKREKAIVMLLRGEEILPLHDKCALQVDDVIAVFCELESEEPIRNWINNL